MGDQIPMRDYTILRRPMIMGRTPTPRQGAPSITGYRTYQQTGQPVFDRMTFGGGISWKLRFVIYDPVAPGSFDITIAFVAPNNDVDSIINAINTAIAAAAAPDPAPAVAVMEGRSIAIHHLSAGDSAFIWIRKPVLAANERDAAWALGFPVENDPFAYVMGGDVSFTPPGRDDTGQRRVTGEGTASLEFGDDWNAHTFNRAVDILSRELDRHDARGRRPVAIPDTLTVDLTGGYPYAINNGALPGWMSYVAGSRWAIELDPSTYCFLPPKPDYAAGTADDWAQDLAPAFAVLDVNNNEILVDGRRVSVIAVTRGDPVPGLVAAFAGASWQADTDGANYGAPNFEGWSEDNGTNVLGVTTIKEIDPAGLTAAVIGSVHYSTAIRVVDGAGNPIDLTNYIEPGDIATITGHDGIPFSHNGNYIVERIANDPELGEVAGQQVQSLVFLRPIATGSGNPTANRGVLNYRTSATGFGNVSFYASGSFATRTWLYFDPPVPPWFDTIKLKFGVISDAAYPDEDTEIDHVESSEEAGLWVQSIIQDMKGPMVTALDDWEADPYTYGTAAPGDPPFVYDPATLGYPGDPDLNLEDIGRRMDFQGAYNGMGREGSSGGFLAPGHKPFETYSPVSTFADRDSGTLIKANVNVTITKNSDHLRMTMGVAGFRFSHVGKEAQFLWTKDLGFGPVPWVFHARIIDFITPYEIHCDLTDSLFFKCFWLEGDSTVTSVNILDPTRVGVPALKHDISVQDGDVPKITTVGGGSDPNQVPGSRHYFISASLLDIGRLLTTGDVTNLFSIGIFEDGGYWGNFPKPIAVEFDPYLGIGGRGGGGIYALEEVLGGSQVRLCEFNNPGDNPTIAADADGLVSVMSPQGLYNTILDGTTGDYAAFYSKAIDPSLLAISSGMGMSAIAAEPHENAYGFHGRACVPKGHAFAPGSPNYPEDSYPVDTAQPYYAETWWAARGSMLLEHHGTIFDTGVEAAAQTGVGQTLIARFYGQSTDDSGAAAWFQSVPFDISPPGGQEGDLGLGVWGEGTIRFPADVVSEIDHGSGLFMFGVAKGYEDVWPDLGFFWNGAVKFIDSDVYIHPDQNTFPEYFADTSTNDCSFLLTGFGQQGVWAFWPTFSDAFVPVGSQQWGYITPPEAWYNVFGLRLNTKLGEILSQPAGAPAPLPPSQNGNFINNWQGNHVGAGRIDMGTVGGGFPLLEPGYLGGYLAIGLTSFDFGVWDQTPTIDANELGNPFGSNHTVHKIVELHHDTSDADPNNWFTWMVVDPPPGAVSALPMRYIGSLWDDLAAFRAQLEQGAFAYGNMHPRQFVDAGVAQDFHRRGGVFSHFLFISDDIEDGMSQSANPNVTGVPHFDFDAFAKIPKFMYTDVRFVAMGSFEASQDYINNAGWGDVILTGPHPNDYDNNRDNAITVWPEDLSTGGTLFQLFNPVGEWGPVRVDDTNVWLDLFDNDRNPYVFAPIATRRSRPDGSGDEEDWYPFSNNPANYDGSHRRAGLGENAWFLQSFDVDLSDLGASYSDLGGIPRTVLLDIGNANLNRFRHPDLGREIEIWQELPMPAGAVRIFWGYIYEVSDLGRTVRIRTFDSPGAFVPPVGDDLIVVLRGIKWQRVSAEFNYGTRFMHAGVPWTEPGHVLESAQISGNRDIVQKGSYKRWNHRWLGHDWTWIEGNINDATKRPDFAEEGRWVYHRGSAHYDNVAPNVLNRLINMTGLNVAQGTYALAAEEASFNSAGEGISDALNDLDIESDVGGFAAHTLALPHEWNPRGDTSDPMAPWVSRVIARLVVRKANWTNWYPFVVIMQVPTGVSNMPGNVVAGAIFDSPGDMTVPPPGTPWLEMLLDTEGLMAASQPLRGGGAANPINFYGFPVPCPLNDSPQGSGVSYVYLVVCGMINENGTPGDTYGELEADISFHGALCEYYTPEVISGY